jgi:site-specific DNA-methyltransferase (adenine-specific)
MKNRNLNHSDNWATPKDLYDELNREFNFDFDPCPLNIGEVTPDKDGLLIEWGKSNFINPPYSKNLKEAFVKRAIEESKNGKVCVMLLPVSTSTKLFHKYVLPNANEIRFIEGRVRFEGVNTKGVKVDDQAGMHDSMVVVFGSRSPIRAVGAFKRNSFQYTLL